MLLAIGPQLVAVNPSNGSQLSFTATTNLSVAPRDLTFRFNEGQAIDQATIDQGIRIVRSGLDGEFVNDAIDVEPGYAGIGEFPNEVIVRFAETLPDDLYRIVVDGTGADALTNLAGEPFNNGADRILSFELNLGAQIIAVVPQPISRDPGTGELSQATRKVMVYFNDDDLFSSQVTTGQLPVDPSVVNTDFYQLIATGVEPDGADSVTNTDDDVYHPTTIHYDPVTDTAELTFAQPLDDLGTGVYRLRIGTNEAKPIPPQRKDVPAEVNTGEQVDDDTVLDNNLPPGEAGQISFDVADGGASGLAVFGGGSGGVTVQGRENSYINQNFIFELINYIEVIDPNPAISRVVQLGVEDVDSVRPSRVTMPATLVAPGVVASEGEFVRMTDPMGVVTTISWRVETTLDEFDNVVSSTISLRAFDPADPTATPEMGGLRLINYLDQNIGVVGNDDFLLTEGTPGTADFRVSTRDGKDGVGFDQGGVYEAGPELVNAQYEGWAADKVSDLQNAILGQAKNFTIAGTVDAGDLPPTFDPEFGAVKGLNDVSTALAWRVDPSATEATITTFLELDPSPPILTAGDTPGSSFNTALPINLDQLGILVQGDGSSFADGQTITVSDKNGSQVVFELNDPAVNPTIQSGRTEIAFDSGTTGSPTSREDMVAAIATAIDGASLNVDVAIVGYQVSLMKVSSITLVDGVTGALVQRLDSLILSSSIDPEFFPFDFPGRTDEPGHRDISAESHIGGVDNFPGIQEIPYNFQDIYGFDPNGNVLHNVITANQKQRAREVFELYANYLGVQFIETADLGFTIVTGDLRALDPNVPTGPGGVAGLAGAGTAIMDAGESWNDAYGANWFLTAMHEIGHLLGLGHTYDLPPLTIMGQDNYLSFDVPAEGVFPGDADIVHGQVLHRPESNDIDLYRFELNTAGRFSAETIAERQDDSSLLDTVLRLYRQESNGSRTLISQNDDYFSEDSLLEMTLQPGIYFVGVSASGNSDYNPVIEDTGFGGRSQGDYDLRLNFRPAVDDLGIIRDADKTSKTPGGTALDGDADGVPGGVYSFWFQVQDAAHTIFVDKAHQPTGGAVGTLANPYNNLEFALAAADPGDIVRVVGNGGADGDLATLGDNLAYEIGQPPVVGTLSDGARLNVPRGVTLMVDAGAVFKLWRSTISVGSSAVLVDHSAAALQILGTPGNSVVFTSYDDQSIGVDTNPLNTTPDPGDWGGIIIRNDLDRAEDRFDYEAQGVFINYVNHADMRYGGGRVSVASIQQVVDPIHMIDARPTVSFNDISFSADAAVSANPDSFEESTFQTPDSIRSDYQVVPFTSGYKRIGPDIHGNTVTHNTINGLFVRIDTPAGNALEKLTVAGRFDDTDITHVISENLIIEGTPGGPVPDPLTGDLQARTDAQLRIDPGVVVKMDGSRIQASIGTQILAEGLDGQEIIFTSLLDNRYGAGGTFDTSSDSGLNPPSPGDWGGLYAGPASRMSLDHVVVAYGGGLTRVEGSFAGFNAVEIHQAEARIANSVLEFNASGVGGQAEPQRAGRGNNEQAAIFVRGAQPIIVGNIIRDTTGDEAGAININVNSLNARLLPDYGRSTGAIDRVGTFRNNQGPLVRNNQLANNSINGMIVRGGTLTTEGVWDDTDIVHVVFDEITVPDLHTFGGLRLASSTTQSLVIKFFGRDAGFTTTGKPLDIDDRVGGMLHVIGQPGHPVVMTSLNDDSVGAGLDTANQPQLDTDNHGLGQDVVDTGVFDIDLNFGPNILGVPAAMEAAEMAAEFWEQLLNDPVSLVFDFELDPNLGAGLLGGAASEYVNLQFDAVRDAMVADAGPRESLVNGLPTFDEINVTLPNIPTNPFELDQEMLITRANAKALGFADASLPGPLSQYDPNFTRDADIVFNGDLTIWDFDRTDGSNPTKEEFYSVVVHEIGHALGFISSVDDVDAALGNAAAPRMIQMNTLDMFRFEPGDAEGDFTNAARVLDPRVQNQVFYDGGTFNPVGIPIPELQIGEIPMSTGQAFGDGNQASHWKDDVRINNVYLGIMDPTSTGPGVVEPITFEDRRAFDLIGWDIVSTALPGDWNGVILEQYTHDRNVAPVMETEVPNPTSVGTNDQPETAQFLGALAPNEKAGDDNLRLGFDIQGFLSKPSDVDVYSFDAVSGTEVWLDLDTTWSALDTVVELVNSEGHVLARSINSLDEGIETDGPFADTGIAANGLQKSLFNDTDFWTVNPHDAGMRVVLPGAAGETTTYHVRVRSNTAPGKIDNASAGLTSGSYDLQLRMQELDEFPGTTITFADIRYATNGILVRGGPMHSPLLGESAEDDSENDRESRTTSRAWEVPGWYRQLIRPYPPGLGPFEFDFQEPQRLGNLLTTDQAAISVAGALDVPGDVDLYLLEVAYDSVQDIADFSADRFVDVAFDIDYADGFGRADTNLSIYEAVIAQPYGEILRGPMVFTSQDSNDPDDQPGPLQGADVDDLSRGSNGQLDPLISTVTLAEGLYIVAVTGSTTINGVVYELVPTDLDQFTNFLPTNPFVRLGPLDSSTILVDDRIGEPPPNDNLAYPVLFSDESVVPFNLNDVTLFVTSTDDINTTYSAVDPFLGNEETILVLNGVVQHDTELFDIQNPFDPNVLNDPLLGYTIGTNDANSGNLYVGDLSNLIATNVGDDGIETSELNAAGDAIQASDVGVQFEAITFDENGVGYAVGYRGDATDETQGLLFRIDVNTGAAVGTTLDDDAILADIRSGGAGVQIVPRGVLDTTLTGTGGRITGIAFMGGQLFAVAEGGGLYEIVDYAVEAGAMLTYIDQVFDPDPLSTLLDIPFSGLTLGPQSVEEGAYSELFFGVDNTGELYAFDVTGQLQPIFLDAALSISTGIDGANGLTFSKLEENPWHITERRGTVADVGHNYNATLAAEDPMYVNQSLYFGDEDFGNYSYTGGSYGHVISDPISLEGFSSQDLPFLYFDYFLVSDQSSIQPIDSLRVFASDEDGQWHMLATNSGVDLNSPMAVDVDPNDDFDIDVQQLFDNSWEDVPDPLTADLVRNGVRGWPPDDPPRFDPTTGLPIPDELEGIWRQARVDLSDFAGMDNLRLRFEFSTASSIDFGDVVLDADGEFLRFAQGTELQAVPGAELRDGDTFTLADTDPFEFELGLTLVIPPGARITAGETFTIDDGVDSVTYEYTMDGSTSGGNIPILFDNESSALDLALAIEAEIVANGPAGVTPHLNSNRLNLEGAIAVTQSAAPTTIVEGEIGTTGHPVLVHSGMTAEEVAASIAQAFADVFADGNLQVIKSYRDVVEVIGHVVVDPGPLRYSETLPGDDLGAFDDATMRNVLNFTEGAYIDNIVVGFVSRGEKVTDGRQIIGLEKIGGFPAVVSRNYYVPEQLLHNLDPVDTSPIQVGEYQLEIRTVTTVTGDDTTTDSVLDPRTRATQSVSLYAPSGVEIIDGRTFTIGDGVDTLTFEFEDLDIGNGVSGANIPIEYTIRDPDFLVAQTIREKINSPAVRAILNMVASSPDGIPIGPSDSNQVDLYGNVVIETEPAPNGIPFLINEFVAAGNRNRPQGQLLITSNQVRGSLFYGIVVEDSLRDLPTYDFFPRQDHSQFTTGDYIPHPGAARNLRELNPDSLSPGVTIANNVVAGGGEGGIHFGGDPDGFVIIAPLAGDPPSPIPTSEVWEDGNLVFTFAITDHNGLSVEFEFDDARSNDGVQPGRVPIVFDPNPGCPGTQLGIPGVGPCMPRYHPIYPDVITAMITAIENTNLDVTIFRGKEDEIFVEGAANVTGVEMLGARPVDWFDPWYHEVAAGAVPFGRVVNNTLVGRGGSLTEFATNDIGILIEDNAGPTVLNNIIANFDTAVAADYSITEAVLGGTLFQGNNENIDNVITGDFVIDLTDTDPLFVDLENGNYYLQANSRAIDSSVDSLEDRPELVTVRDPLGIAVSPILAPTFDVFGQQRIDDPSVEPPDGFGNNVFKDRGAIDRVDFVGPSANLVNPLDNDGEGNDRNPNSTIVQLAGGLLTDFSIQLVDGNALNDPLDGTGIDPLSVTSATVVVTAAGATLVDGLDYSFTFDSTNSTIRLIPLAGFWPTDTLYMISLDNTVIRDIANNPLAPNQPSGETSFTIELGVGFDFGDAPDPSYPTIFDSNGARHILSESLFLGVAVDVEEDGLTSANADGDGIDDDGVFFDATLKVGDDATFSIFANDAGLIDAWIDFNGDGDWDDPGEQIFASEPVVSGVNQLDAYIPVTSVRADTFARFRLSSQGGLAPTGLADDGEVEDYRVNISGNPWQNTVNPLDVNGDGFVTPIDALLVINELNVPVFSNAVTGELPGLPTAPNVPPASDLALASFVDVSGSINNGGQFYVTPLDALLVINFLNAPLAASASASAEGGAAAAVASAAEANGRSAQGSGASSLLGADNGAPSAAFGRAAFQAAGPSTGGSLFIDPSAAVEGLHSNGARSGRNDAGSVDRVMAEYDDGRQEDAALQLADAGSESVRFARIDRSHRLDHRVEDDDAASWSDDWRMTEELDIDALDEMFGAFDRA